MTKRITLSSSKVRLINGCPYVSHSGCAASLKCGLPYSRNHHMRRSVCRFGRIVGLDVLGGADLVPAQRARCAQLIAEACGRKPPRCVQVTGFSALPSRQTARWQTCCGSKPSISRAQPQVEFSRDGVIVGDDIGRSSRRDSARRCGRGRVAPGRDP